MSRRTPRPSRLVSASPHRHRPRVTASSRSTRQRKSVAPRRPHEATAPLPPVSLGGYPFPELSMQWTQLPHQAGLFAILERVPTAEAYRPLLLSEAGDIHAALATLSRRAPLPGVSKTSVLVYAALVTNVVQAARQHIVTTLRTLYQLPPPVAPVFSREAIAWQASPPHLSPPQRRAQIPEGRRAGARQGRSGRKNARAGKPTPSRVRSTTQTAVP